jgi:undecaprenyl-diphosphatase
VSRSGITITAALLLGFSRRESARFSFLLAGPIIAMGAADGVLELLLSGDDGTGLPALVTGVVVSFVTGFLCIKYFLRFLESRGLLPFVIYRLALALVILWLSL